MILMKLFKLLFVIYLSFVAIGSVEVPKLSKGHAEIGNYPFLDMNNCGYINPKDVPQPKIIQGAPTTEGEFPWSVSIHFKNISASMSNDSFICGGALIHMDWVMSAKHCFINLTGSQLKIYSGSINKYGYHNIHLVTAIINNPGFDLSLLRLDTPAYPVLMANHYVINTICLPKEKMLNVLNEEAVIGGFGLVQTKNVIKKSSVLLKTVLLINPYSDCLALNYSLYDICATEAEHMTCFGDSGSALVQFDGKRAVVIGLVIGGNPYTKELCGPGVLDFSRVSFFIDWIKYYLDNRPPPQSTSRPFPNETNYSPGDERQNINFSDNCGPKMIWTLILFLSYILFL